MSHEERPVLLVDDHDDTRRLIAELLELDGYRVVVAANGGEARAAICSMEPCVIIVDLGLPDVSGIELVAELRARLASSDVRIYALSGFAGLRARALAAGCDGFLLKPVFAGDLRDVIRLNCVPASPPSGWLEATSAGPAG